MFQLLIALFIQFDADGIGLNGLDTFPDVTDGVFRYMGCFYQIDLFVTVLQPYNIILHDFIIKLRGMTVADMLV